MEENRNILSNSQLDEGLKSGLNGESRDEDTDHCGHNSNAQQEMNQNKKVKAEVDSDYLAHPAVSDVKKEIDSNSSAMPDVIDKKTEMDSNNSAPPLATRKKQQKDTKESATSGSKRANKRQVKTEPRTQTPLTNEEQDTSVTVTLPSGKKRRKKEVKMEAKPESPDEDITSSEVPVLKKRRGRPKKVKAEPSERKAQQCDSEENTEVTDVGTDKKRRLRKKIVKTEPSSQSSEVKSEVSVLNGKRQRSRQSKVKVESSPRKPKQESKDTQVIAVKAKRGGRGIKTETHKGTGLEDPASEVKTSRKRKQNIKEPGTSKWERNVVKYKWAKSAKDKYVGAHVSIAGGIYKAVLEAEELGARAFGMFLRSQRQWASKPLADKDAQRFRDTCKEYGYHPDMIIPHGSYLMNCGSPDDDNLQKSRDLLLEELQRCEKLGLTRFNFHPGSTCGKISVEECLDRIGESINQALAKTTGVTAVIENMCCQGNTVGGRFEELKGIIKRVQDKSRVGICLDTCHMFAAGYDVSTEKGYQNMMEEFNHVVGRKYLKAIHLNDSKADVGSHLDRHENIGEGRIGKVGFQRIMNDPRLNNIPMILETPCPEDDTYEKEVRILYSMCK